VEVRARNGSHRFAKVALCASTKCARRKDKRGFDLISDVLPFGRLWYTEISHAIGYAKFYSRSHNAVIRVSDSVS